MDGLEFIELAASDPEPPTGFLSRSGFSAVGNADLPSLARSFVNVRLLRSVPIAIRVCWYDHLSGR